ncbi:MAG: hypothetical protein ACFFDN_26600 [Candidatus Hodarchaeota archaeon]
MGKIDIFKLKPGVDPVQDFFYVLMAAIRMLDVLGVIAEFEAKFKNPEDKRAWQAAYQAYLNSKKKNR